MRRVLALLLVLPVCGPALSQGLRDGDLAFSAAELSDALSGSVLEFFDGSLARYADDAGYEYRYRPEDPPFVGTWETTEESEVCVTFDNGFSRCDVIVQARDRLVLITGDGLRFPVRDVRALP